MFLAVLNIVFFLIGGTVHTVSVWISYGFIHFAYLMVIVTPLLIRKSSRAAVFGFSICSISSAYFLLEFVIGLVFIFKQTETLKVPIATQVVIAGIYAVILLSNLLVNEHAPEKIDGERTMEIDIYLKFIGRFDVPIPEPTPEEIAAAEADRKRRAAEREKYLRKKARREQKKLEAQPAESQSQSVVATKEDTK